MEANQQFPARGRGGEEDVDDDDDKPTTSTSPVETEEFPEDFKAYRRQELNWARLQSDGDGESHVMGWVFWSPQDDKPSRPPVSDCENLNVIPDSNPKVRDMIRLALGRIILHPKCGRSLVQFWAATTSEGRTLLMTQNQPFALGKTWRSTWGLCDFRMKSKQYKFYGDIGESGEEELGLLGRVFLRKFPEFAPDVRYYSLKEYPHRDDASLCQVRSSWALPVLEHSSQICVGVLELVSAVDTITDWYDKSFLGYLNNVFQDLGLQYINPSKHCEAKEEEKDEALMTAFHELTLVLDSVYKIHELPLVLTWVPCGACDALTLRSVFGEYLGALEANNNHLVDFLTASTGYHLQKGQVAERVLSFPNMLYCSDVKQFSIAEYPLVPFVRQSKLSGWFTICLHSSYTGEDDYILEFFLPVRREDNENIPATVRRILGTMKTNSKTFKLASGEELGDLLSVEVFDFQNGQRRQYRQRIQASLELIKNRGMILQLGPVDQPSFDAINDGMDIIGAEHNDTVTISKDGTTNTEERKQKKPGVRFDISLEDVLRYSAMSRRDAARKLKVSESTLKRVCRRYRIDRWPPRDMNKEISPAALPNDGDIVPLDSREEASLIELDDTINGAHDVGTENMWLSTSHLENENPLILVDLQQPFGRKRKDVGKHLGGSVSTMKRICKEDEIKLLTDQQVSVHEPLHNRGGMKMRLDSAYQPSLDAGDIGRSFISTEQNNSEVTCSEGTINAKEKEQGKTGVRIQISLEEILQYSRMKLDDAASKLNVSSSTLKRVCREYGVKRWPPRNIDNVGYPRPSHVEHKGGISQLTFDTPSNQASESRDFGVSGGPSCDINKVGPPQPSHVEHSERISYLTYDTPSNQVSASVAHIKADDMSFQETKTVTIRAKYVDGYTIKFQLSTSSKLVDLHHQVAKRLNLEAGTYDVTYKDEDGELILMACDEDLKDCIKTSGSVAKNIVVELAPKKPMTQSCL